MKSNLCAISSLLVVVQIDSNYNFGVSYTELRKDQINCTGVSFRELLDWILCKKSGGGGSQLFYSAGN